MKLINATSQPDIEECFREGGNREVYVPVAEAGFTELMASLSGREIVLIGLFCVEGFEEDAGFTLFYVLEKRGCRNIVLLQRRLRGNTATSIAALFPSAGWFEREIRDGFGVTFPDAVDQRHLFLHEVYPEDFHPLRKDFPNQPVAVQTAIPSGMEYPFKEVTGEGVYQIPVGPVHAGIIEPGHFRFSVIGETIFNLEIRMFYKHRGIEKLAEGKTPGECVHVAESISGDETVANAVAFCQAVEKIAGVTLPARAWYLRTVFLELERIYSHLGDLAGMIIDVAYPRGASPFFILREEIFRQNEVLTGSRFMKGIIRPGGLAKDVPAAALQALAIYLDAFPARLNRSVGLVDSCSSAVDRLETTGVIKRELVNPLNITGPAARAAGVAIDTRHDHPYGLYPPPGSRIRTGEKSDVLSRFRLKAAEIADSVALISDLLHSMPSDGIFVPVEVREGHALSLVEAARGQSLHWVAVRDGLIERYKVRTASFCNWPAIEHAVMGNIVPDFPLINKSMNLSYAGTDL